MSADPGPPSIPKSISELHSETPEPTTPARCTGLVSSGKRKCRNYVIGGETFCVVHGGRSPQVLRQAQETLQGLTIVAVDNLEKALTDEGEPCALCGRGYVTKTKLQAVQMVLDRGGLGATLNINANVNANIHHEILVSAMTDEEFAAVDEIMQRVLERVNQEQKVAESS